MRILKHEPENPHFYDLDGNPRYDAGLRQARREDLVPGASSFSGVIAKPQIERYNEEQAYLACVDNPIQIGESVASYVRRVSKIARHQAQRGRRLGSACHDYVCQRLNEICGTGPAPEFDDAVDKETIKTVLLATEQVVTWCRAKMVLEESHFEQPFADRQRGFGGKRDLYGPYEVGLGFPITAVVDFKFRNVRPEQIEQGREPFYPEDVMQLAGYALALNDAGVKVEALISVVGSTNKDTIGCRWEKAWDIDDWKRGLVEFLHAHAMWRSRRKFYWQPREPVTPLPFNLDAGTAVDHTWLNGYVREEPAARRRRKIPA